MYERKKSYPVEGEKGTKHLLKSYLLHNQTYSKDIAEFISDFASSYYEDLNFDFHDFSDIYLANSTFVNCSLKNTKFNYSDLRGSVFVGCEMELTEFYGANLTEANFMDTKLDKPFAIIINDANLTNVYLDSLAFDDIDADSTVTRKLSPEAKSQFHIINRPGFKIISSLFGCNLTNTVLKNAFFRKLEASDLTDAKITSCIILFFSGNNFTRTFFHNCKLAEYMSNCSFTETKFENVLYVDSDLSMSTFKNISWHRTVFKEIDFTSSVFNDVNWSNSDFKTIMFEKAILTDVNFEGSIFENIEFEQSVLNSVNFKLVSFKNVNFRRAIFNNVDFRGSVFDNSILKQATLNNCTLD